jgi:sugar phosphate isomerase/epimerase
MTNRRKFIRQSGLLAGGILAGQSIFAGPDKAPLLSYSTLGCPQWPLAQILDFGTSRGYQGIEIRGILGELNLVKVPGFNSASNIKVTKRQFADKNLKIVNLGASAEMHHADPVKRKSNLDGGKAFITLAAELGCPYVRVFPNALPADKDRTATLDLIASGLKELGDFAKGTGVTVLMESHGDLVHPEDILYILKQADSQQIALVWDIYNMWTVTHEAPAKIFASLRPYIRHTHIKDGIKVNGKEQYQLLGKGEAPVAEAIRVLKQANYAGYYSFEWEKMWHPEIAEPEIAIADFPSSFRKIYNAV